MYTVIYQLYLSKIKLKQINKTLIEGRFYKMWLFSIAILKSISFKINIYWYVSSALLKKLLQSRALVLPLNYTKRETTATITLSNATVPPGILPPILRCQFIFPRPCHPLHCPCAIFWFRVISPGNMNRLILCKHHSRSSIASSNARILICLVWFGTRRNI